MEDFAMTQLTDQERTAQMKDIRSFDEQGELSADGSRMTGSVLWSGDMPR